MGVNVLILSTFIIYADSFKKLYFPIISNHSHLYRIIIKQTLQNYTFQDCRIQLASSVFMNLPLYLMVVTGTQ